MTEITIVGGGIAGLSAAIRVAELGGKARILEAQPRLGGRGRTEEAPYRANFGAHALYLGAFSDWLAKTKLLPPNEPPRATAFRFVWNGKLRRFPLALVPVLRTAKKQAPVDLDYRSWLGQHVGEKSVRAAVGFTSLPTFHGDPGQLSAVFVHERVARSLARPAVTYPKGGFAAIVARMADHARALGVAIETGEKRGTLPDGPTIVATDLRAAAKLLEKPELDWPAPRTAMFDVALTPHRRDKPQVLDLDRHVYVSNYSAYDDSLAPNGEQLYQAIAGLREGEDLAGGIARIHAVLDRAAPGWRDRTT